MKFLLPTPDEIYAALRTNSASLSRATFNTGLGALLGFAAAVAISFCLALFLSLSSLVRASLYPYLMILQMTPIIIFAPILVLWVGAGLKSVVVITFLICFFPLVVNTTQGLISTDRNLVELFRMYRASKLQETFLLRVPAALPVFLHRPPHRRRARPDRCPRRRLHSRQFRRRWRRSRLSGHHLLQPGQISRALCHRRRHLRAWLCLCRRGAPIELACPSQVARFLSTPR